MSERPTLKLPEKPGENKPEEPKGKMLKVTLLRDYWPSTTPGKDAKKGETITLPMDEALALLNADPPKAKRADKFTPEDV